MFGFGRSKKTPEVYERKEPTVKTERRTVEAKSVRIAHGGAWDAAQNDRLIHGWVTGTMPINQQLEQELRNLRARSRNLAKNDPYIRRFFQLCKSNVIGSTGMSLRSSIVFKGKPDREARKAVQKAWKEFCKPGVCCAQDRLSMRDIDNLLVETLVRDGEIIILAYTGKEEGKFGITFKIVDPELLDVNIKDKRSGNDVRMGIETDRRGRVVAYHFHSTDSTHDNYYSVGGRGYMRIAAENVIHKFLTEYPDQLRGFPHAAAAMMRLRILNGYQEAELVGARNAASSMGFIIPNEDGVGFEGDDSSMAHEGEDDDYDDEEIVEVEEPLLEAESGAFHRLSPGAKVETWDPNHPNNAYEAFVKNILRGIACGLGVDYNSFANDLEGVNFSSIRAGVLESRELWKSLQEFFIEHIKEEMFNRWIYWALLSEAIVWPSGSPLSSAKIEFYKKHAFQGRRWDWVDPYKDSQTNKLNIDERLKTRSMIMRDQGLDPDEVWEEFAEEQKKMEELGITPQTTPTVSIMKPDPKEDEENAEESKS